MPSYTIVIDEQTKQNARLAAMLSGHDTLAKFIPAAVAAYAQQVLDANGVKKNRAALKDKS